jgi:hypothetical protein
MSAEVELVRRLRWTAQSLAEVRDALGVGHPRGDTWSESDGCWADVWFERHGEYLSCDAAPDPCSELGLCAQHEGKMRELKGEAVTIPSCQGIARFDSQEQAEYVAMSESDLQGTPWRARPCGDHWHVEEEAA